MVDILVRDYEDLALEERVRAIKTTEHLAKILVNRDIGRAEQEGDIGTVYLHPRQSIMMLAQEMGAEDAPEIQALLRREEAELRLDPRVVTMQEVWAEEKLEHLARSWFWYPEPDNSEKLSKEQLLVARSLAHLYGHNWAWALTGRPPHEYGKVVKSVKRPRATTADIYRHTVDLLGEDGYGLNLPINSPEMVEGNVVHQTGTGRLTWLIRPDGSVQLTVCRPAGWVLRAELGATRPRKVEVVRNPAVPLHRRHVEALERPIKRLAPRWVVPDTIGPILADD